MRLLNSSGYSDRLNCFGPAAAWIVPSVLGIGGSIIGANQQNHNAQQAQQTAQQATAGQDQINQEMMNLYQQQQQEYQQQYAPLIPGLAGQYGQETAQAAGMFPSLAYGYDTTAGAAGSAAAPSFNAAQSYLSNPQNTLSSQYGPQALGSYSQQGQQGLGQPAQNAYSFYNNVQQQGLGPAGGAAGGFYGGEMAMGLGPTAGNALSFYNNEAVNGMDPATWDAALNSVDVGTARSVADAEKYAGTPNATGLAGDVFSSGLQAKASAAAQMAGQNMAYKQAGIQGMMGTAEQNLAAQQSGAQGLFGTAQGQLGAQMQGAQGGMGTAQSNLQAQDQGLAALLQGAGGLDAQTMQMIMQAYQNPMNALSASTGFYGGNMSGPTQFVGQGQNFLPSVASGMGNISNQYANAAQNAAQAGAYNNMNSPNLFSTLGSTFANYGQQMFPGSSGGGAPLSLGGVGGFGPTTPPPNYSYLLPGQ